MQRKGARHMPFYRIVAADTRSPRDGRFIEQLGYYDPLKDPAEINVDTEKVLDWFRKGAKPSETVKSLFSRVGIMETWHHVRQGKSLEEIEHIQEEARKRAEAVAAMERRAKESAGGADEKEKPGAVPGAERKPEEEPAPEAEVGEKEEAQAATEPETTEPETTEPEATVAEPAAEEKPAAAEPDQEPEAAAKPDQEPGAAPEPDQEPGAAETGQSEPEKEEKPEAAA